MVAQTLQNVLYGLTVCERQFYMYFDLPAIMLNLTNIVMSIC